jgi:hypothetical protein
MDFDRRPLLFAAKSSVADPFQSMSITSGANRNDPRPPDPQFAAVMPNGKSLRR